MQIQMKMGIASADSELAIVAALASLRNRVGLKNMIQLIGTENGSKLDWMRFISREYLASLLIRGPIGTKSTDMG